MKENQNRFNYIVRLEGGLGNQMFQYAHARYLMELYGGRILFDDSVFSNIPDYKSPLYHFSLCGAVPNIKEESLWLRLLALRAKFYRMIGLLSADSYNRMSDKGIVYQASTHLFNFLREPKSRNNFIYGNWMSHDFFGNIRDIILHDFQFSTKPSAENENMIEMIQSKSNPVCLHIRRGDYCSAKWSEKLLVCDYDYYKSAIDYITQNVKSPTFFVFSNSHNDLEWIKKNYCFAGDFIYVDMGNPDFEELRLMKECRCFILSNSTFSWWAQYLCSYAAKIVVAPKNWNSGAWDVSDLIMDDWHLVDNAGVFTGEI